MNTKKNSFLRGAIILVAVITSSFSHSRAAVIYVDHSAAGANNGTDWANAFTDLSDALAIAASGDEIWVASGVYKPSVLIDFNGNGGSDTREATFQIPNDVSLYGGFAGTEGSLAERNWEINLTILSGDIDNNDLNADGDLIAEDTDDIVGNNAYHVLYTANVSGSTFVDGFIITAGSASIAVPLNAQDPNLDGGGWYNLLSAPTNASSPGIFNTIFQGNFAESEGGGFFSTPGTVGGVVSSQIQSSKFVNNKSDLSGGAIQIGSFSAGTYQPTINQCEFSGNEAFRRGGAIYFIGDHAIIENTSIHDNRVTAISPDMSTLPGSGGGVALTASNAQFTKCIFEENSATGNPTGAFEGGGGGAAYMSINDVQTATLGISEPKFINCGFYTNLASGNTSAWGGAVVHLSDAGVLKPQYTGCVFTDNQAQSHGGAIANFTRVISPPEDFDPELSPRITNCTFTENHAGQNGGAIYTDGFLFMGSEILNATITNCILWDNTASSSGPEIFISGGNISISFSLIEGSGGSGGGWNASLGTDSGNNIDDAPNFVNGTNPIGPDNIPATNDDGLRLLQTSPGADAGNNAAPGLVGIANDYIGGARIQGGDVDMGAYETVGIIIPDLDIYWLEEWRPIPPFCLSCPWAVLLADPVIRNFRWQGPAQLILQEDYTIVTGTIISSHNQNVAFEVYLKLGKPQDWNTWSAKQRTYMVVTPEAAKAAALTHKRWSYFELSSESYLKGKGNVSGLIQLKPWPQKFKTGFQLGQGANGWDDDLGLGGLFEYSGRVTISNKRYSLKGLGSLNADAEKCIRDCTPLIDEGARIAIQGENLAAPLRQDAPTVYPNPASDFVSIKTNHIEGVYMVRLVDDMGQLQQAEQLNASEGSIVLPLKQHRPGIYHIVVTSSQGETQNHKVIIK